MLALLTLLRRILVLLLLIGGNPAQRFAATLRPSSLVFYDYPGATVVVVEKWDNLDALNAHLVAPHMGSYREQVKDLVTGMNLQVLEPA